MKRPSIRNGIALFVRSERRQNSKGMIDARRKWDELPLAEKQVWGERALLLKKVSEAEHQAGLGEHVAAMPLRVREHGERALEEWTVRAKSGLLRDTLGLELRLVNGSGPAPPSSWRVREELR